MEEKKEYLKTESRFSFVLSVNENNEEFIICKRDFNVNNFDEKSKTSTELKEAVDEIVFLIDRDIKSKSRVYTWCNMPTEITFNYDDTRRVGVYHGKNNLSKDVTDEFIKPLPNGWNAAFKFTFYDGDKPIITKVWDGDCYPFIVRNTVDITNKRYRFEGVNPQNLDFHKSFGQRSSAGRQDISFLIMKHLSSVCSSYYSQKHRRQVFYKQNLPDLKMENVVFVDGLAKTEYIKPVTKYIGISEDKLVCDAYTNISYVGYGKTYENISPFDKWVREAEEKEYVPKKLLKR